MPHDAKGQKLEDGDEVLIRGTVKITAEGEDYCNVIVTTAAPMLPDGSPTTIALNAGQIEKA